MDGLKDSIKVDKSRVEELQVVVKKSIDDLMKIFKSEGFTRVKYEHKKPSQIEHGLNIKIKKARSTNLV